MDKVKSLPQPIVKTEDKGYKAYFKIYNIHGKKVNTNGGFYKTKAQALNNAIERQKHSIEICSEEAERRDGITIEQALNDYLEYLKLKKNTISDKKNTLSADDYEDTNTLIKHYLYGYGSKQLDSIQNDTFRNWITLIQQRGSTKNGDFSGRRINKFRTVLNKFITFLKNSNYISNSQMDEFQYQLFKADIYKKDNGYSNTRIDALPTYADIYSMVNAFKKQTFEDWYMYAFLMLGFFSAMRMSEMLALRWESVDFNSCFITIKDSITKRENKASVYKRNQAKNYKTKTESGKRVIPMMNIYYFILKDYKQQYKMKFNLEYGSKEFENAFVFPSFQNLKPGGKKTFGDTPTTQQYTNTQWINRQLQRICKLTENQEERVSILTGQPKDEIDKIKMQKVQYFPCRYLRHGGCTHLAKYHDYLETEMVDYMGHSSLSEGMMIKAIYEELGLEDIGYRTRNRHPELYIVNNEFELNREIKKYDMIAGLIDSNTRENALRESRANSIGQNLDYVCKIKNKKEYRYTQDEEYYVEEWRFVNSDITDIKFIKEKVRPEDEIDFNSKINIKQELDKYKNGYLTKEDKLIIEEELKKQENEYKKKKMKRKKK